MKERRKGITASTFEPKILSHAYCVRVCLKKLLWSFFDISMGIIKDMRETSWFFKVMWRMFLVLVQKLLLMHIFCSKNIKLKNWCMNKHFHPQSPSFLGKFWRINTEDIVRNRWNEIILLSIYINNSTLSSNLNRYIFTISKYFVSLTTFSIW